MTAVTSMSKSPSLIYRPEPLSLNNEIIKRMMPERQRMQDTIVAILVDLVFVMVKTPLRLLDGPSIAPVVSDLKDEECPIFENSCTMVSGRHETRCVPS